jgi:hypothetical protein
MASFSLTASNPWLTGACVCHFGPGK